MKIFFFVILSLICSIALSEKNLKRVGPQSRIAGGSAANTDRLDWVGQVLIIDFTESQFFLVGSCSIINNRWVVTSVHNIAGGTLSDIHLRLGYTTLGQSVQQSTLTEIDKAVAHEGYIPATRANDVALLRTSTVIVFTSRITSIQLPSMSPTVGRNCWVSGWGITRTGEISHSTTLLEIQVQVINLAQCQVHFSNTSFTVADEQMCTAAGNGKSACEGDSGSPLVCVEGSAYVLQGTASVSPKCGGEYPTVYADIYQFKDWIIKTTSSSSKNSLSFALSIITISAAIFL